MNRWTNDLVRYRKALACMARVIGVMERKGSMDEDEEEGLKWGVIQSFEFTHELAWKVMKDYAEYQGVVELRGSRDAFRWALQAGLIDDKGWMKSIEARNLTSHDYDEDVAERVYDEIVRVYYPLFVRFEETMAGIEAREREEM